MTSRRFDDDAYLTELDAQVLSCAEAEGGFLAELDQTIFYPRGGGQPADRGFIGEAEVLDVFEQKGKLLHLLDRRPDGERVHCRLDWAHRQDMMQQHSGQHILSALILDLFKQNTLIMRIEEHAHIELPQPLTTAELLEVERRVNQVIAEDRAIRPFFVTEEELDRMDVRGRISEHEHTRLVEIEGLDLNRCGGTHLRSTAEVGELLITGTKEVRGVFRLYYACGNRARRVTEERKTALLELQRQLDCEQVSDLYGKVLREHNRLIEAEDKLRTLKEERLALKAEQYALRAEKAGEFLFIAEQFTGEDMGELKRLSEKLTQEHNAVVLFSVVQPGQLSMIFMRSKGKTGPGMGEAIKPLLDAFSGKGGGSAIFAQGVMADTEESRTRLAQYVEAVRQQLM